MPNSNRLPIVVMPSANSSTVTVEQRSPIDPASQKLGTPAYVDAAARLQKQLKAAEAGDVYAMMDVETAYDHGIGTPPDPAKLLYWLEAAARKGLPKAKSYLATLYQLGHIVPKDDARSFQLTKEAAESGYPGALNALGLRYRNGQGVDRDPVKGIQLITSAAQAGNPAAMLNLASIYGSQGSEEDDVSYQKWLNAAAQQDVGAAEYLLGLGYATGTHGFLADVNKSLDWYRHAANHGEVRAMFNLGNHYLEAIGGQPDYDQARQWFEMAASLGHGKAMWGLGYIYYHGLGVSQDPARAKVYFCDAAHHGWTSKEGKDCPVS